jgi:isopenicillin-N N-acyltransferase-like protein
MLIPVLTLRGSARERGRQCGAALATAIESVLQSYERRQSAWGSVHFGNGAEVAELVRRDLIQWSPQTLAYLSGVGEGADQPLSRLLNAVGSYDTWQTACVPAGCTSIAWRSNTGEVWLGQTVDWFSDLRGHLVLTREVEEDGTILRISLAEAGFPPISALNRWGVATAVNALTSKTKSSGATARAIIAAASECQSAGRWTATMACMRTAAAFNITMVDARGGVVGREFSPAGSREIWPGCDGMTVHTNHFRSADLVDLEGLAAGDLAESTARFGLATRLFSSRRVTLETYQQVFSTHDPEHYPRTLCCHQSDQFGSLEQAATLAAVVCQPTDRRLWLCAGNPCANDFNVVSWTPTTSD